MPVPPSSWRKLQRPDRGRPVRGIPQIRNVATLGGNLCQDVRCWYYRYPRHMGEPSSCARKGQGPCLAVKGDNRYHAILGGKKCFAVCPSDTAVALAALDAQLVITGPEGQRKTAITDFYNPLGLDLQWNEILTEIEVPVPNNSTRQHFFKFTLRRPIDFSIVSLAAVITEDHGVCRKPVWPSAPWPPPRSGPKPPRSFYRAEPSMKRRPSRRPNWP